MMNNKISVREVLVEDAKALLQIIPIIDKETEFTLRGEGEFRLSLHEEESFIRNILAEPRSVMFVASCNDNIVGSLGFRGNNLTRYKHTGEFGMGILKQYWGQGIGTMLIEHLLSWSEAHDIRKINLKVVETNIRAIKLYERFGFEIEGVQKNEVKIADQYYNLLSMGKFI
ncbi:GNAT family N-acetyltransferase [Paenibacillus lentus]|uniref:GNAT family N-acetyltransferase n=1 Tax=Paenibacillus lentus TaxID=1338368 RepID=A0A3Q8SB37_9BACL|nr:GNAT family N-acetyltransferase [Paenibacillus lentus]AZK46658.1 GNAT family N-acetyltransferase [Paenibacillus lentus]